MKWVLHFLFSLLIYFLSPDRILFVLDNSAIEINDLNLTVIERVLSLLIKSNIKTSGEKLKPNYMAANSRNTTY